MHLLQLTTKANLGIHLNLHNTRRPHQLIEDKMPAEINCTSMLKTSEINLENTQRVPNISHVSMIDLLQTNKILTVPTS